MRFRVICSFFAIVLASVRVAEAVDPSDTFCNPLNLEYTQQAADPSVIQFEGDYYMVASKCRGYWYSSDLKEWTLVPVDPTQIEEIDAFAPTIWEDHGRLYYTANGSGLYHTETPKDPDSWQLAEGSGDYPAFRSKADPTPSVGHPLTMSSVMWSAGASPRTSSTTAIRSCTTRTTSRWSMAANSPSGI